jgi:hypothetical protein
LRLIRQCPIERLEDRCAQDGVTADQAALRFHDWSRRSRAASAASRSGHRRRHGVEHHAHLEGEAFEHGAVEGGAMEAVQEWRRRPAVDSGRP